MKKKLLITIFSFFLIFSCSEESKLKEKYDCIGVDDCLSKYKFDGARAYMSISEKKTEDKSKDWEAVISAESDYWIKEGEFKKAISIIDQTISRVEYNSSSIVEYYHNLIRMKAISTIVDELNDKNEFNEARKWVLKCPDVAIDGFGSEANMKDGKIRDVLNKKIDDYEKLSK